MKSVSSVPAFRWASVLVAVAAGVGWSAASAAPSLNLAGATADTKAIAAAGGQADVVLLGDSLTFDHVYSFRPYFTQRLQSAYGNAGPGFNGLATERGRFGAGWTAGQVNASDPAPHHGLDGLWLKAMPGLERPAGGEINPLWDKAQLHYVAEPGGGRLTLTQVSTGARVARIDTNAETRQVRTLDLRFAPTDYPAVRYQPDGSGPVTLLGLNLVTDDPGVRVHRASNGGWGVDHYLRRDWTFDAELRALGADMVMIALGANDVGTPRDVYAGKLRRLVDRVGAARPEAEVLLVAPYDFGKAGVADIAGAIEQVAAERGAGFINLYQTAGSYSSFQQRGYLSDGLHFTEPGARYVGGILGEAFVTNGASLSPGVVPEPGGAALVLAGGALALRRRRRK